jgi:hypothetical protein
MVSIDVPVPERVMVKIRAARKCRRWARVTGACAGLAGLIILAAAPPAPQAAEWSSTLKGGGQVTVDPRTNRITVQKNGVQTQLWDGVHRLEDGSSITVRSGQVVPNQEILRARRQPDMPEETEGPGAEVWIGAPIVGASPCEKLAQRVCGAGRACADQDGCALAGQLLEMEQQERAAQASANRMTYASGQCQEADRDRNLFATCGAQPAPWTTGEDPARYVPPSSCQLLVEKVCGSRSACGGETACDAAQQLVRLAQDEPAGGTTDQQCREALGDDSFFKPCGR